MVKQRMLRTVRKRWRETKQKGFLIFNLKAVATLHSLKIAYKMKASEIEVFNNH